MIRGDQERSELIARALGWWYDDDEHTIRDSTLGYVCDAERSWFPNLYEEKNYHLAWKTMGILVRRVSATMAAIAFNSWWSETTLWQYPLIVAQRMFVNKVFFTLLESGMLEDA